MKVTPHTARMCIRVSAFDKAVDAKLEATVKQARDNAAREALEFLSAEPLDPAGPLPRSKARPS